jgi:hypothetical protein
MTRSPFASALAVLLTAAAASTAIAQTPASSPPGQAAAPARAKWVAPVKGVAEVEIIKTDSKRVGKDLVTNFKIKNMTTGAIALFRIDEYWYDGGRKLVTGDTQRYGKPFLPGEVIEIMTSSPAKPGAAISQWKFSHANGDVKPKMVKKFD